MRATEFIAWPHERNLTLATCTQATLDQWHATHLGHERSSAKAFLTWAMRTRRMPSLDLPRTPVRQRQPITQHQRLQLLRKLLTDDTVELMDRVTAILTLLYGQPLTKITRLSISDIVTTEEEVLVRFGEPPTPVPAIFAPLLVSWRDQRPNMRTATNPNSQWLFPAGGRDSHCTRAPWSASRESRYSQHPWPRRGTTSPRAPSSRPRHRRLSGHPLHDGPQALHRRGRHLEDLRPRRPRSVTTTVPPRGTATTRSMKPASRRPRLHPRPPPGLLLPQAGPADARQGRGHDRGGRRTPTAVLRRVSGGARTSGQGQGQPEPCSAATTVAAGAL